MEFKHVTKAVTLADGHLRSFAFLTQNKDNWQHAACCAGYVPADGSYVGDDIGYAPIVGVQRQDESRRYATLKNGAFHFDFNPVFFDREPSYELSDVSLVLPRGSQRSFGVYAGRRPDTRVLLPELTRNTFGVTEDELNTLLYWYARVQTRINGSPTEARWTFSNRNSNRCDITHCNIPVKFPYISFSNMYSEDEGWSHVSLIGFFIILAWECRGGKQSYLTQSLELSELDNALLERVISHPISFPMGLV
jgi:hypothetical protein